MEREEGGEELVNLSVYSMRSPEIIPALAVSVAR
jgi:hypothetical protein